MDLYPFPPSFFLKSSPSQPPFTEPLQCSPIKYDNFFVDYWWVCVYVCLCLYTTVYKYNVFYLFLGGDVYGFKVGNFVLDSQEVTHT